jgi:hypothetical protein
MENEANSLNKVYDVEKIINRKYFKNKKFYLVKWLCYPITEATWEPKSNLKQIDLMLKKFEHEYPYSIDKEMYDIYCTKTKKRKNKNHKIKKNKEIKKDKKFLSKKTKLECFTESELNDAYYDKLKSHLYINKPNKKTTKSENDCFIDLCSTITTNSEENTSYFQDEKESIIEVEEKEDSNDLIVPILE